MILRAINYNNLYKLFKIKDSSLDYNHLISYPSATITAENIFSKKRRTISEIEKETILKNNERCYFCFFDKLINISRVFR